MDSEGLGVIMDGESSLWTQTRVLAEYVCVCVKLALAAHQSPTITLSSHSDTLRVLPGSSAQHHRGAV